MDTLSVCIIARNEEENLSRCLKSVKSIADEIILIDTGSTDNTINIAQEFNAQVIKFPWNDNFSSARNKALEIASKDWILCIDCDEALDNTQVSKLKNVLNDSLYLGFRLKLINIIDNKPYKGEYLLRIIKNNSGFYFSGRINEKLNNSLYNDSYLNQILNLEFILYNFGYDYNEKQLTDRCNRNLSIYLSYADKEKNYLYYYNIANEYFLLNKYTIAINNYIKAIELNDNYYISSYLSFLIVKTYYIAQKYNKAILMGERYLLKNDAFREIYLLLSICYEKINNLEESRENLKLYLKLYEKVPQYYFRLDYINLKNFIPEMLGFNLESLERLN
ncbi:MULTISPECIES: glycosyltransferase [unclassified Clostridium]|uniref:tetratricopeptide repeat-containing glycosyltransferase family 2 protein n=1 Tax=unclassified Clostridium TaxID=2614128 RepID=UPI0018993C42|nr:MULTISPECIES: glycosyltransferase [unclassified Clostridium]MCR1951675.1 glycosyltransferase [Clostridium sp. DSM 100503]